MDKKDIILMPKKRLNPIPILPKQSIESCLSDFSSSVSLPQINLDLSQGCQTGNDILMQVSQSVQTVHHKKSASIQTIDSNDLNVRIISAELYSPGKACQLREVYVESVGLFS